jgi:ATP-binding cassette subfamily F protein 3
MVNVGGVSKGYGAESLFEDVDMRIVEGDRVGLIGENGCGKTTLLRIVGGLEEPDDGFVRIVKGTRVGLLGQEVDPGAGGRLLDEMLSAARGIADLEDRKRRVERRLEREADELDEDEAVRLAVVLGELQERIAHLGGYEIEAEAARILAGLGFREEDHGRDLGELSGGWRMRFELARLLLEEPDLLLLDEPTNHLDIESMQWLEEYLGTFRGAFVIITHDRRFLDRTVKRIAAVEDGTVNEYRGGYTEYRRVRDQQVETLWKHYEAQQARIREIEEFIARNRVRKDRAKVVQGRIRTLEKMDRIEPPRARKCIHFAFPQPPRTGSPVVQLREATKRYGDRTVLDRVNASVLRGEKVALVGPNGSGKTTLLSMLAGELDLDGGERILGSNTTCAFYAQHQLEGLSPSLTVKEEMTSIADRETMPLVRGVLGAFLFSDDEEVDRRVEVLSGGEKARLSLAKLLLRPAGLLLMDEPTNHLDIESREVLEEALRQYDGTLVFVSHDRQFINALATRIIEVGGGGLDSFPGGYDDYAAKKSALAAPAGESPREDRPEPAPRREPRAQPRGRKAEQERRRREARERNRIHRRIRPLHEEMIRVERDIERRERRVRQIESALADPDTYAGGEGDRVKELQLEHAYLKRETDELMSRWEDLNRRIEVARRG